MLVATGVTYCNGQRIRTRDELTREKRLGSTTCGALNALGNALPAYVYALLGSLTRSTTTLNNLPKPRCQGLISARTVRSRRLDQCGG